MDRYQFNLSFEPMAQLKWQDIPTMKRMEESYWLILKNISLDIFTEVMLQIGDMDFPLKDFPLPGTIKRMCWDEIRKRRPSNLDTSIGNRAQDIKAQAEFYATVGRFFKKYGNAVKTANFVTPLCAIAENCASELNRMDAHHRFHGSEDT